MKLKMSTSDFQRISKVLEDAGYDVFSRVAQVIEDAGPYVPDSTVESLKEQIIASLEDAQKLMKNIMNDMKGKSKDTHIPNEEKRLIWFMSVVDYFTSKLSDSYIKALAAEKKAFGKKNM